MEHALAIITAIYLANAGTWAEFFLGPWGAILVGFLGSLLLQFLTWGWAYHPLPTRYFLEVVRLFQCVREEEMEELLDAEAEARRRATMPKDEFRADQRERIFRARQYLERRRYNARLVLAWAYIWRNWILAKPPAETEKDDAERYVLIEEIIRAATEYDLYSFGAIWKLRLWDMYIDQLFRFPIPNVADLLIAKKINGLAAYQDLMKAIGDFSRFDGGEECYVVTMFSLCGRIPEEDV
jgi:hypothetical protein